MDRSYHLYVCENCMNLSARSYREMDFGDAQPGFDLQQSNYDSEQIFLEDPCSKCHRRGFVNRVTYLDEDRLAAFKKIGELHDKEKKRKAYIDFLLKYSFIGLKFLDKQSLEVCLKAVQTNGMALKYVKNENKTAEVVQSAILQNPLAEIFNPDASMDIVEKIVFEEPYLINKVPEKYLSEALCLKVLRENPNLFKTLTFRTEAICKEAIKENPHNLRFIDDIDQSLSLQRLAVSLDPQVIQYLKNPKEELLLMAVKKAPSLIETISKKYITEPVCLSAVKADGDVVKHIPRKFITSQIAYAAVNSDPNSILHLHKKKLLTRRLVSAAARQDSSLLRFYINGMFRDIT